MTEKKKRGLLSWLGFGDEEQAKSVAEEQTTPEEQELEAKSVTEEASVEGDTEADHDVSAQQHEAEQEVEPQAPETPRVQEQEKPTESFFARLKRSLARTKSNIGAGFFGLFKGKKIDDELFEDLEEQLLIADVGMDTTVKIIDNLTEKASHQALKDGEALYGLLKDEMSDILKQVEQPLEVDSTKTPYVILMVGVMGWAKPPRSVNWQNSSNLKGKK